MYPTKQKKGVTMITKHTTTLGDRLTRRIGERLLNENGTIKNGYTLILGIVLGLLIANI